LEAWAMFAALNEADAMVKEREEKKEQK